MRISYEKLWQIMNNNPFNGKYEISYSMAKLNNNEPVSLEIMLRFCKIFHCDIGELMQVFED